MTLTWAMVVAQLAEFLLPSMYILDLQFESSHWHILMNFYLLLTVENIEQKKRPGTYVINEF